MASSSEETDPPKLMQRATVYLIHQAFLHWQDYAVMEIVSEKEKLINTLPIIPSCNLFHRSTFKLSLHLLKT